MCPVSSWGVNIIQHIIQSKYNKTTTVNWFLPSKLKTSKGTVAHDHYHFSQTDTIDTLRRINHLNMNNLPYRPENTGTHSLRSGAAVALFLSGVDPIDIMLIGRWSSDAFLVYIRPYIIEVAKDLSTRMLGNETYHTNSTHSKRRGNRDRHPDDLLIRNDPKSRMSSSRIRKAALNGPSSNNTFVPKFHVL